MCQLHVCNFASIICLGFATEIMVIIDYQIFTERSQEVSDFDGISQSAGSICSQQVLLIELFVILHVWLGPLTERVCFAGGCLMSFPKPGVVFQNRYLILEELGEGGMGAVYRARQLDVERDVSLKLLRSDRRKNEEAVSRFYREFKLLNRLWHPNVMRVYSLFLDEDCGPVAVCEYLEGRSLACLLSSDAALSWQRAVNISVQIAEAMRYVHDNGLIYRDLKPDNIMLQDSPSPDFVKVVDFGLAVEMQPVSPAEKITWTGQAVGSAMYMSPEQARSEFDARSDIYSLGCVLFEMLSGEPLFSGDSVGVITHRHENEDPIKRFPTIHAEVPEELLKSLSALLEKAPERRPESMKQVSECLSALLVEPGALIEGSQFFFRRRSLSFVAVTASVVAVVVALIIVSLLVNRPSFLAGKMSAGPGLRTERLSLEKLQARAVALEKTSDKHDLPAAISYLRTLRDDILAAIDLSRIPSERNKLQDLLAGVLVELAQRQLDARQRSNSSETLNQAKKAMRDAAPASIQRRYYFLHSCFSKNSDEIEDDLSRVAHLVEGTPETDMGYFQSNIFAANRLCAIGQFGRADVYVERALEQSRRLAIKENIMIALAFKIVVLNHLNSKGTDDMRTELAHLIAAEKDSPVILDQAMLMYRLEAWEVDELLLEESIASLKRLGRNSKSLPACIYFLEKIHLHLNKPSPALADLDALLALYDQSGILPDVPPKSSIERERAALLNQI